MAEMLTCSYVAGSSSSPQGICLSFQVGQILRTFTISQTISTIGRHLGIERGYSYHTALSGVLRHHA